ncbi:hypothetical protein AB0H43_12455 [Hamadaea sp. NPDC050747]|uniref:hypothetical protein n=1 Tax=Hamadaea sp. NPDC050747 TaxID=3155789 RepID=UPI0033E4F6CA
MTAASSSPTTPIGASIQGDFTGPVRTVFSAQPEFPTWCTDWTAFDVPRLWDSVRDEDDPAAWQQVKGWEGLSELLADHHDRLVGLRAALVSGWDPATSQAASTFVGVIDSLLLALRENAYAHMSTARGLHAVLTTLKSTRTTLADAKQQWDKVTNDFWPEWWDHAAEELNTKARDEMVCTDASIQDERKRIIVAGPYDYGAQISTVDPPGGDLTKTTVTKTSSDDSRAAGSPRPAPPPVPGYNPIVDGDGPTLSGGPVAVPAVPGTPISMLPIPPGHPAAPIGGAYFLPGPGIGAGGSIKRMPIPPGMNRAADVARSVAARTAANWAAEGRSAMGIAPMGVGGNATPAAGTSQRARRPGEIEWEVARGVPPVIGDVADREAMEQAIDDQRQLEQLDEVFGDWFASLASPWVRDMKPNLPNRTEPL